MRISYDDQFLFSVGQDGSLFAFKVHDKDGRTLKREKDVPFAEEVLVTKSDLEEKVKTCTPYTYMWIEVKLNMYISNSFTLYMKF